MTFFQRTHTSDAPIADDRRNTLHAPSPGGVPLPEERVRTQLIADIACLVQEGALPDEARAAGLTLIGWLARRMPGEAASRDGVDVMIQRAARKDAGEPNADLVRGARRPKSRP
jgi:hypothetical protein